VALKDLVLERQSTGQRVHPVLRAYFGWGIGSLILWSVTLFAAGIGVICAIAFCYSLLKPVVGPARHEVLTKPEHPPRVAAACFSSHRNCDTSSQASAGNAFYQLVI